ncbi:hypothetical protein ANCDUO_15465 [Ancylostoma duodenale]|uniref:Uncharacterized protein n=1 Tax=Ancylostoma duodenale TaxID=51022 RepID=A0A0C2G0G8_9BILA|nr:hypothetical protein ANCDUO_15465 [Ancylostoma duodenale]
MLQKTTKFQPVVETLNTGSSVQQAQDLAKRRLVRYQSVIEANDGGEVISAGTPEGRVYYLSNKDQWMFLERSTDERIQTLLICENTGQGQKFTQKFTSR